MPDVLVEVFVLPVVLAAICSSLCYICLSFHLYSIGIHERSDLKKRSARSSLLISLSVFVIGVICWNEIGNKTFLYYLFPFIP